MKKLLILLIAMSSIQAAASKQPWPADGKVTCSIYSVDKNYKLAKRLAESEISLGRRNTDVAEDGNLANVNASMGILAINLVVTPEETYCSDGFNCSKIDSALYLNLESTKSTEVTLSTLMVNYKITHRDALIAGSTATVEDFYELVDVKTKKSLIQKIICKTSKIGTGFFN